LQPEQGFHLLAGLTRGVSLHAVVEEHLASTAGDQFEQFHIGFVLGLGLG
jgi:hypothetical protein